MPLRIRRPTWIVLPLTVLPACQILFPFDEDRLSSSGAGGSQSTTTFPASVGGASGSSSTSSSATGGGGATSTIPTSTASGSTTVTPTTGEGGAGGNQQPLCTPPHPSIVAWWSGDDTAQDLVAGHHGEWSDYADAFVGRGFLFVPAQQASLTIVFEGIPGDFTVEFWVKADPPILSSDPALPAHLMVAKGYQNYIGTANAGPSPCDACNGQMEVSVPNPRPFSMVDTWGDLPMPWHHVAVTYQGNLYTIYVDGLSQPKTAVNDISILDNSEGLTLGGDPAKPGNRFFGILDEVTVYNSALSADDVAAIHGAAGYGKCKPSADAP